MKTITNILLLVILTSCTTLKLSNSEIPDNNSNIDNIIMVNMINVYREQCDVKKLRWSNDLYNVTYEKLSANVTTYNTSNMYYGDDDLEITIFKVINGDNFNDLSISLFAIQGDRRFNSFMKEYFDKTLNDITKEIKILNKLDNGHYRVDSGTKGDVYYYANNLLVVDTVNNKQVGRFHGVKNIESSVISVYASKTLRDVLKAKLKACYLIYLISRDNVKLKKLLNPNVTEISSKIRYEKSYIMVGVNIQ